MNQVYEFLNKQGLIALWKKIDNQNTELVEAINQFRKASYVSIYYDTKENWDSQISLVSEKKAIYIYTNYQQKDGKDIPGLKVGDGGAYLIDLPFIDTQYFEHINNTEIHITQEERENWNNKVSCELNEEQLILNR